MKALRGLPSHLPERLAALDQLSTNLQWSPGQTGTGSVRDPTLHCRTMRSPVALLGAVNPARLDELALDAEFLSAASEAGGRRTTT